jgi:hypothetical protein
MGRFGLHVNSFLTMTIDHSPNPSGDVISMRLLFGRDFGRGLVI